MIALAVILGLVGIMADGALTQNLGRARIVLPLGCNDIVWGRAVFNPGHHSEQNVMSRISVSRSTVGTRVDSRSLVGSSKIPRGIHLVRGGKAVSGDGESTD